MGTAKYCKDTFSTHRSSSVFSSLLSYADPKDAFLHLSPREMNIPRPSTIGGFSFSSLCCQRRQSCRKQAQGADCVSNKCQDSSTPPPFLHLPPTSLRVADNRRGRGKEGDDRGETRPAQAQKKPARGLGRKRNQHEPQTSAQLQADVTPGHLPRTDNNKAHSEGRRWPPRSEFLLLPSRCSQPKQRPQCKQRRNVRLWQSGAQRPPPPPLPAPPGKLTGPCLPTLTGRKAKLPGVLHTLFMQTKYFSPRCCHTISSPDSTNTLPQTTGFSRNKTKMMPHAPFRLLQNAPAWETQPPQTPEVTRARVGGAQLPS